MKADHFRHLIQHRIDELVALSAVGHGARATVELDQQSVGRLSRQDALQQQAMAMAQENRRQQEVARLRQALTRIDKGEFGICAECGEPIAQKRLEFDLTTEVCVACRA